jgi:hypothetical protein
MTTYEALKSVLVTANNSVGRGTGGMVAGMSTLCFNCGQTGHFQNQCPEPHSPRAARATQFVRPPVEDRGGAGPRSFVASVNLRGGVSALAMEDETIGGCGFVAALQAQVNLQTELLEARALIDRQAEIMEHQMRSAAQPTAGPPGIRPPAGGAVSQIGGWSEFFGARSVAESQEQTRARSVALGARIVAESQEQARARSVAQQQTVMRGEESFGD